MTTKKLYFWKITFCYFYILVTYRISRCQVCRDAGYRRVQPVNISTVSLLRWKQDIALCLTVLCSLPEHSNCQPFEVKPRHCVVFDCSLFSVWTFQLSTLWGEKKTLCLTKSLLASILICLLSDLSTAFMTRFHEQWTLEVATSCVNWLTIWPPISPSKRHERTSL